MRFSALSILGALALVALGQAASAQSAAIGGGPAEVPPDSYSARFYIDSQGCMFIRTGTGWVPQVTRRRQPVCGLVPSLARSPAPAATVGGRAAGPTREVLSPSLPQGYVSAWKDDRLNPLRGPRTAQGDTAMARIWDVSKVPMRRRPDAPPVIGPDLTN